MTDESVNPKAKTKTNFTARIAEEFAEARGVSKKRKEYLKSRDAKRKTKKAAAGEFSEDEDVRMDSVRFGEQVDAPPVLRVKPKIMPNKRSSTLQFKRK